MSGLNFVGHRTGEDSPRQTTSSPPRGPTRPPPPRLSDDESAVYYYGLPSRPVLVASTGYTLSEALPQYWAFPRAKELRIAGDHKIKDIWEDNFALKVHDILDENCVDWNSNQIFRIGYAKESCCGVVLWIGVKPESLSYDHGLDIALQCKRLLLDHDVDDVEVEIYESTLIHSHGPPSCLEPAYYLDPSAEFRMPFTSTIGTNIHSQYTPCDEGTGGFFLAEGGDRNRLLLVTARHVVFQFTIPLNQKYNVLYERTSPSQPRHNILIFGDESFKQNVTSIRHRIETLRAKMKGNEAALVSLMEGVETERNTEHRKRFQYRRTIMEDEINELGKLHKELLGQWGSEENRILGSLLFSPPIAVSTEQYTQDFAVIAVDDSKIDPTTFLGNAIDVGTKFWLADLTSMMCPNEKNPPNSFHYPRNPCLMSLQGFIPHEEMRNPRTLDKDDKPCIMVLKRGRSTNITVGRANNLISYTRGYFSDGQISKEWAILQFDYDSGAFSAQGDSGSVVVDGAGRIGGIITGGTGLKVSLATGIKAYINVTFVTPIESILKIINGSKILPNTCIWPHPASAE